MTKKIPKGMIDVSKKKVTSRKARAQAVIKLGSEIIKRIKDDTVAKGNVFEHARIAGIMAAKRTGDTLPLCHPLPLDCVSVTFDTKKTSIVINTEAISSGKTGVEMEALLAASTAALTIYDLCKMYSKAIEMQDVYLLYKSGGKTGVYTRK